MELVVQVELQDLVEQVDQDLVEQVDLVELQELVETQDLQELQELQELVDLLLSITQSLDTEHIFQEMHKYGLNQVPPLIPGFRGLDQQQH